MAWGTSCELRVARFEVLGACYGLRVTRYEVKIKF